MLCPNAGARTNSSTTRRPGQWVCATAGSPSGQLILCDGGHGESGTLPLLGAVGGHLALDRGGGTRQGHLPQPKAAPLLCLLPPPQILQRSPPKAWESEGAQPMGRGELSQVGSRPDPSPDAGSTPSPWIDFPQGPSLSKSVGPPLLRMPRPWGHGS